MNIVETLRSLNLNGDSHDYKEGISLFTAIKNRKESFELALQSWIAHPEIDEIIVVDWGSDESLLPLIERYQDGRIFLAVVLNQPKWILSYAYNLSARLTTYSRLLKVDADVKILEGFFENHELQPRDFFCGNWRNRRNDNELHLNGIVYLHREDFFRVNGYNEFIKFYGWDDSDLYQRLENAGLTRKDLKNDHLYHIPHGGRTTFQDKPAHLEAVPEEERATFATFVNRALASTSGKWTTDRKMTEFILESQSDRISIYTASGNVENPVSPSMIQECEAIAIRQRLPQLGIEIGSDVFEKLSREELIAVYNQFFMKKKDLFLQFLAEITAHH